MSYTTLEMLIDGKWTKGTSGKSEPVMNPATDEVLGELPHASPADLDEALAAAERGFQVWKKTPPIDRQKIMNKAADLLIERQEEIARLCTMEMGKPLAESRVEIGFIAEVTRWYGEEGKRAYGRLVPARAPGTRQMVYKEPVGPVAAFTAWNFPGTNNIRKIAGALGAGCSIILKASEETPATPIEICRCFQDAGLPDGVLNLVYGVPDEVARHLLASPIPKKVSLTGSVAVGKHLQKLAADTLKRCTMELGGHAPVMVFDDADVDKAAMITAGFKFRNAGQVCISPTRFYLHEKVADQFMERFERVTAKINVGNGLEDGVQMGPLVAPRRVDIMNDFISDAKQRGAEIVTGGERIGNAGNFFQPTILRNVPVDAKIMVEEPFGPVAPMTTFSDTDEVVERANSLEVGLAAYAFTSNGERARHLADVIETGLFGVNHPVISTPETPFGGVNESGYGSEGGIEGLDAYLRTKFVTEVGV